MKLYLQLTLTHTLFLLYYIITTILSTIPDYIETTLIEDSARTIDSISNICGCDKNRDVCDPFCCCDDMCSKSSSATPSWKLKGECWKRQTQNFRSPDCYSKEGKASITDLYSPIRFISQNYKRGLCVIIDNENLDNSLNIEDNNSNIKTTEDYDNYVKDRSLSSRSINYSEYNMTTVNNTFDNISYSYSIGDDLLFLKKDDSKKTLFKLKFPSSNSYGKCINNIKSFKYLNSKKTSCGFELLYEPQSCQEFNKRLLDSQLINSLLEIENIGILQSSSSSILNTVFNSTVSYYKVDISKSFYYKVNSSNLDFTKISSFNQSTCTCKDIIKDVRFKFIYINYTIVSLSVDIYLYDIIDQSLSCNKTHKDYINVNFEYDSSQFDYNFNYKKSGNPGYKVDFPLISGVKDEIIVFNNDSLVNNTVSYFNQFKSPRKIIGAANSYNHKCLYKKDIELKSINYIDFSLLNSQFDFDFDIYRDSIFNNEVTFGKNTIWGCSESLSLSNLKDICINQLWKHKHIYSILSDIDSIGQFGNADRHFYLDWISSDQFDINSYQSIWDDLTNKCLVPAIIHIDIIYSDFGLYNNTQNGILKIGRRLESMYWFGYSDSISEYDNKVNIFNTYIRINYVKIPLSTVWFFASGPKIVFPKNIMYPFKVGTTEYWYKKINKGHYLLIDKYMLLVFIVLVALVL